jgi:hypothetical protein
MAKTYRDAAIEQMVATVEEAMRSRYRLVGRLTGANERRD